MPFFHSKKAADAKLGNFSKPLRRWRSFHAFIFGGLGIQLAFYLTVTFPDSAGAGNGPAMSAASVPKTKSELDPIYGVGSWIWARETHDQQLCRFWRGFEIPRTPMVIKARLRIAVDNSYRLFLDGRELGRGGVWEALTEHDLTLLLNPGFHTLAVEAFNNYAEAGLLAGLHIELADGQTIEIASDQTWKVVSNSQDSGWEKRTRASKDWPAATVVGAFGAPPWIVKPVIYSAPTLQPMVLPFWQTGWFHITLLSLFALVATLCVRLMGKLAIQRQAQQVVQRERARIARDIHDDLTAGLSHLVLLGEVAQSALPAGSESREQVGKVCERARGLSHSMNEIIWVVNSQRDTLRAFTSYVCKYAETFLQPTSIHCRFDLQKEMPDLPCGLGVRRNLFLAVKEALNNAVRHSGASELVLRIHGQKQQIVVVIEDNGIGFDCQAADRERNGLSNMMQQAIEAGGVCSVISRPGAGCRIRFVVPLERHRRFHAKFLSRCLKHRTPFGTVPADSTPPAYPSKSTS